MPKTKRIFDSYLQEEIEEVVLNIAPPTNQYYRIENCKGVEVSAEWSDLRKGFVISYDGLSECVTGIPLFPLLSSEEQARRAVDWVLLNSAMVQVALHWVGEGVLEPYLNLLQHFKKEVLT